MENKVTDIREQIFYKHHDVGTDTNGDRLEFLDKDDAFLAMDERAEALCLELLEYMAKNNVKCDDIGRFWIQGKGWLTKEQLFKNFL